jgi:MoaA/NifB/PqqE/SkfB family radical SAM enzyme
MVATANSMVDTMLGILIDGLDHPELWPHIPEFLASNPLIGDVIRQRLTGVQGADASPIIILLAMCEVALGRLPDMIDELVGLSVDFSQSPLVQGALFHLRGLQNPSDTKYALEGRICETPFEQLDVLDGSSHLCCASWLSTSVGSLSNDAWQDVWNSPTAEAIRASIHDGSYRYCNKGACPKIQGNTLPTKQEVATSSPQWEHIVAQQATIMPCGPKVVNLAYDRTCNLACPSCRVDRYAADDATRIRYTDLQEQAILPMLKTADTVFVTGSGDPFASKNFRQLMKALTPHNYPDLKFQIMTNGMLFTARQWDAFPSLHRRVAVLKISIDAATGPTHEVLRLGAHWPTVMANMSFAGSLLTEGLIDNFELVFTVQEDNFREMGDAVDLAHQVGANGIFFARLTNWGAFSPEAYRQKAVFVPSHPDHAAFEYAMRDERLADPIVLLGDLEGFRTHSTSGRRFVR